MSEPIAREPLPRIQAARPCPISGTTESCVVTERARDRTPLRNIINCTSGLVSVDPVPIEDLRTFYTDEYRRQYKASAHPSRRRVLRAGRGALRRYLKIKPHLASGRTLSSLDVGASSGEFVMLLTHAGIDAKGCEPNETFARFAREELGAPVTQGMIADLSLAPASLDLVTLFHVVEHLEDPVGTLRKFRTALRRDGVLVVEVPNILSANMGFRHKWHKGHLYGFSRETLAAVAAVSGFDVVELGATGQDHNVWIVCRPSATTEEAGEWSAARAHALARLREVRHFESSVEALRANARAHYLLRPRPWFAAARRAARTMSEMRAFTQGSPRAMLQSLYQRGLALQSVQ